MSRVTGQSKPGAVGAARAQLQRVATSASLVVAVSGQASCLNFSPFACEQAGDCNLNEGGACLNGGCAYPDDECPSKMRFDDNAPSGLAGDCYDPNAAATTGSTPADSTHQMDDTEPAHTTSTGGTTFASTAEETGMPVCGGVFEPCCESEICDDGLACHGGTCSCVQALEAGYRHNCAALVSGEVMCWGDNSTGQLGASSNAFEPLPLAAVAVDPRDPVRAITATEQTCVLSENNNVRCWGANGNGQADPSNLTSPTEVVALTWLSGVQFLRAGQHHTCAHDGTNLVCWGSNANSQLVGPASPGPGPVTTSTGQISGLVIGASHGCLIAGESLSCWGLNDHGQLVADPVMTPTVQTPTGLGLVGVIDAAAGVHHTCALDSMGLILCWGANDFGQLGAGFVSTINGPIAVTWPKDAGKPTSIVAGLYHTCAIDDTAALWCWGSNFDGQIMLPPDPSGFDDYAVSPRRIDVGAPVEVMAPGQTHGCALTTEHRVLCWGRNDAGAIGDGTTNDAVDPREVNLCGA